VAVRILRNALLLWSTLIVFSIKPGSSSKNVRRIHYEC
jgi:hypothetical protein